MSVILDIKYDLQRTLLKMIDAYHKLKFQSSEIVPLLQYYVRICDKLNLCGWHLLSEIFFYELLKENKQDVYFLNESMK